MGSAIEMASSDLLWALTRKTNCFLVKRNGLQLTSEPNNLTAKHCFKFSGLANEEAEGVEECPRGITLKRKKKRNVVSMDLKKDFRKVAQTLKNKTEGSYYRKDLSQAALARWYKIWKAQQRAGASSD